MKVAGQSYIFVTNLKYAEEHNGKEVVIVDTNGMVSICKTEEGKQFAAFNSELRSTGREVMEKQQDEFFRDPNPKFRTFKGRG